jgi:hypothetical protein
LECFRTDVESRPLIKKRRGGCRLAPKPGRVGGCTVRPSRNRGARGCRTVPHTARRTGFQEGWRLRMTDIPLAAPPPHSPQNFIPARLSAWHRRHLMPGLYKLAPGWCVDTRIQPSSKPSTVQVLPGPRAGSAASRRVRARVSVKITFLPSVSDLTLRLCIWWYPRAPSSGVTISGSSP